MKPLDEEQQAWLLRVIASIREEFEREIDQGILKRDLYQSVEAMGGRDGCDRLKRGVTFHAERIAADQQRHLELVRRVSAAKRPRIK